MLKGLLYILFSLMAVIFTINVLTQYPIIFILILLFIAYKLYPYFKEQYIFYKNGGIDPSSDTDAINDTNFMTINHRKRNNFFKGNYFKKEKDDRFGVLRKMKTIETIYIEYESARGEFSKRKIEVFGIKTFEGSAYLYAFCHQRGEPRNFHCGSICLLVDKNNNHYKSEEIINYIKQNIVIHIENEYNKKVVLNCLN